MVRLIALSPGNEKQKKVSKKSNYGIQFQLKKAMKMKLKRGSKHRAYSRLHRALLSRRFLSIHLEMLS